MSSAVDVLLCLLLSWNAWKTVSGGTLLRCVVLYVVFGMGLSVAWLRLRAPDLALAEAAVGTALTAVMLLDALGRLRRRRGAPAADAEEAEDV